MINLEISDLVKRCIRILYISTKPTNEEYSKTATVAAIGMAVLGVIGLLVNIILSLIK
ncbi:MAG: protein translocase SEC61 complex subunit gamma [Candidatus Bilamarchaeum sp.]